MKLASNELDVNLCFFVQDFEKKIGKAIFLMLKI